MVETPMATGFTRHLPGMSTCARTGRYERPAMRPAVSTGAMRPHPLRPLPRPLWPAVAERSIWTAAPRRFRVPPSDAVPSHAHSRGLLREKRRSLPPSQACPSTAYRASPQPSHDIRRSTRARCAALRAGRHTRNRPQGIPLHRWRRFRAAAGMRRVIRFTRTNRLRELKIPARQMTSPVFQSRPIPVCRLCSD